MAIDYAQAQVVGFPVVDLQPNVEFVVTQVRSSYHQPGDVVGSLRSIRLGNKRRGKTVRRPFTRQQAGYIRKAHHLLKVTIEVRFTPAAGLAIVIDGQKAVLATEALTRQHILGMVVDYARPDEPAESSRRADIASEMSYKDVIPIGTAFWTVGSSPIELGQEPRVTTYATPLYEGVALDYAPNGWITIELGNTVSIVTWECTVSPIGVVSAIAAERIATVTVDAGAGAKVVAADDLPGESILRLVRVDLEDRTADAAVIWERLPDGDTHVSVVAARQPLRELRRLLDVTSNLPHAKAIDEVRRRTESTDG